MGFSLHIETGNAAMQTPEHVAWALAAVAERMHLGTREGLVRDINGNTVGAFTMDAPEEVPTDA